MENITRGIAKRLVWMLVAGGLFTACSPARYTYLNKVKADHYEIAKASGGEQVISIEDEDAAGKEIIAPEEEEAIASGLVASNSKELTAVTVSKVISAGKVYRVLKTSKAENASVYRKIHKIPGVLKIEGSAKKIFSNDTVDTGARHGLLWSLVAAVILVWLVGVLFTNVGGLVHILLAVALALVVLNLLS